MPQVAIVRIGDEYFREYRVEPDDNLSTICFRYGHTNWRAVYDHPANVSFHDHFLDPHSIHSDTVALYIPLRGAPHSGRSVRGRPIEDYFAVHVVGIGGNPLQDRKLRLIPPGATTGSEVTTTFDGDVLRSNPPPGDHQLASPEFMLVAESQGATAIPPVAAASLPRRGTGSPPLLEPAPPLLVPRNVVTNVVARHMALIVCPMCGRTVRVVESAAGAASACPNDGFELEPLRAAVASSGPTFLAPATPPDRKKPRHDPTGVVCRGTLSSETTVAGPMPVYWDESRFTHPARGSYTLWGERANGTVLTVPVIGRQVWGARSPEVIQDDGEGGERIYEFHEVHRAEVARFPYDAAGVPTNEITPLAAVLRWITIHQSLDPAQGSPETVRGIQDKHIDDEVEGEGAAADVAYHFVVDDDGSIYEGRPLGIKGSHTALFNGGNVGIVMAGDFERPPIVFPTVAALDSLHRLIEVLSLRFGIRSVWGHRQRKHQNGTSSTACPGARLIPHVNTQLRPLYPGTGEPAGG